MVGMLDHVIKHVVLLQIRNMGNKLQAVEHAWNSSQDVGNSLPLYIFSSNFRASGRRRSPLLLGKPVPRQTGQTSFPRPEPSCIAFYSMSLNLIKWSILLTIKKDMFQSSCMRSIFQNKMKLTNK